MLNIEEIKERVAAAKKEIHLAMFETADRYCTDIPELISEVERLTEENKQLAINGGKYIKISEQRYEMFEKACNRAENAESERATLKKALELACKRNAEYAFCGGTEAMKAKHAEKNFQNFIQQAQEQEGEK